MQTSRERILLVESDPEISDLIARETLLSLGYQIKIVRTTTSAIQEAASFAPDIIITDINLPDLSGKDLLVALSSQGNEAPVIMIAKKGMESDLIQAFRLGAGDYLLSPMREAEIVTVVDRAMKQVRGRREQETLVKELKHANDALRQRVRELATIFVIGKSVTSLTNHADLYGKIVDGAVSITESDYGWLLLRQNQKKVYYLAAYRNLPDSIAGMINKPWEDGISSLVALSGEPLMMSGESLERFKVSQFGQSALVVPLKIKKEVFGLLVVMRKDPQPYNLSNKTMLEAVSDYASISLVNFRFIRTIEDHTQSLQQASDIAQVNEGGPDKAITDFKEELSKRITGVVTTIESFLVNESLRLNPAQKRALQPTLDDLDSISNLLESFDPVKK